jgi:hypothetical protein
MACVFIARLLSPWNNLELRGVLERFSSSLGLGPPACLISNIAVYTAWLEAIGMDQVLQVFSGWFKALKEGKTVESGMEDHVVLSSSLF